MPRAKSRSLIKNSILYALIVSCWLATVGCFHLQLAAEYDPTFEHEVNQLHYSTESFLAKLEKISETPEGEYERHTQFYEDVIVKLAIIEVRANAHRHNDETIKQIEMLRNTYALLEDMHKKGELNQITIPHVRQLLRSHFRAILALEIAKKRE